MPRSVEAQQNIVHEAEAGNDDDDNPGFAGLDQVPGIGVVVGQKRPDDESQKREQDRAAHLLRSEPTRKSPKLRFKREQHGHDDRTGHRGEDVSLPNQHAKQED
jgi:hypothetical protein